jgi:hypothetical protein
LYSDEASNVGADPDVAWVVVIPLGDALPIAGDVCTFLGCCLALSRATGLGTIRRNARPENNFSDGGSDAEYRGMLAIGKIGERPLNRRSVQ